MIYADKVLFHQKLKSLEPSDMGSFPVLALADRLQHECPAVRALREFCAFSGSVYDNGKIRLCKERRLCGLCILTHTL